MNPFKTKTLSTILSTFTKTLTDLEALAARNEEQADANEAAVRELDNETMALEMEAEAARKTAARIRELIA